MVAAMTTTPSVTFVGVDVSKDFLDVVVLPSTSAERFANDEDGVRLLAIRLEGLPIQAIAMEATGGYQRLAHATLVAAGWSVAVVMMAAAVAESPMSPGTATARPPAAVIVSITSL